MPEFQDIEALDPRTHIIIKGARVNNLKNVNVAFKRNKLTVVTGLSGSGKSSLAFDTLYAEGQRMYVESLSSYARQFLGRMEKPEVDYIKGVSPAIAIEQRVSSKNPRSTVGTTTEIYDYLKLLFARAGTTYSPVSGNEVKKDSVHDVSKFIHSYEEGQKLMILSPLNIAEGRNLPIELDLLLKKGFNRVSINQEIHQIEDVLESDELLKSASDNVLILIDRAAVKFDENGEPDEDNLFRMSDSVQTAFFESNGVCIVQIMGKEQKYFSDKFELDEIVFEEPSVNLFTFNNPYGACRVCEGFGKVLGIDEDLVIPDKTLSLFEGAIAPWRSERMSDWLSPLLRNGINFDFPIHRAFKDLTEEEQQLVWTGNEHFKGLNDFFKDLETKTYKVQYRVMLSRYRGRTVCPDCRGSRLRKDASYVKIDGYSITDLVLMPINKARVLFDNLKLEGNKVEISKRIFIEIKNRLEYLERVGLGYLTLNRLTSTLSGGEFQRIKLATSLGSALVGSMYILDEPSIGLHPRDTQKLISVLKSLRDIGNTVIVVEHEEEVMQEADEIIDIGPNAGNLGGELVFQGTFESIKAHKGRSSKSHTINFLSGQDKILVPERRRKAIDFLKLSGATENNLKNVDVKFPLGVLCVVTGVSGSGKSTLVRKILYPAITRQKGEYTQDAGKFETLTGSVSRINQVEMVDQNPIGKSSRSNPVTYIKAYDAIRALMSDQPLAKQRDYKPAFFSFNVDGGRCEACAGEGEQTIEMQFMADVKLTCESCKGRRFKQEVLEVKYLEKDISDILNMTIDEALDFFEETQKKLYERLLPLQEVGLGYIKLGQSSNTLSGGEAQRVKLAFFLGKGNSDKGKTLFIFDEPTTGLHFHDIQKLLKAMNALIEQGDSVIIIEHNMEVIKSADWIIDLGPDGGEGGGDLCFEGTPEEMVKIEGNYTADFLKGKL
ncbi:excinuclease ABC subunit UvrA [Arcticibacterium luteifluviistationis]|uniref:UvrABC system protein A n=1 Tax=Arcticibacterium luteifluviistationis TaxID=1784714 RepID=A0A2Z4GHX3_9BACT|nr:excinuclease ABC subunit UvrA [Arcticibacterium luteifluviistationis]AWW00901.1 excinuclease ABC subunit A [Arcticibacterium luteifluviistationis]